VIAIPEEIVLAVRFELGIAGRAELADLVDARIASLTRVPDPWLELATPGDMPPDEIAVRLVRLTGSPSRRFARMAIVIADTLLSAGTITLDRAVRYVRYEVSDLDDDLFGWSVGLLDMHDLARTRQYHSEADVREELHAIAEECALRLQR
jgi:hypothetical protein